MPPKILIIDDSSDIRYLLSELLGSRGYIVLVSSSGQEGLERFEETPVDLVITDLEMSPGIDGIEVTKRIRVASQVPIIMFSGTVDEVQTKAAKDAGANLVLCKPHQLHELIEAVAILRTHRAHMEMAAS